MERVLKNRPPLLGELGGQHPLGRFIDHLETYGPHVVEQMISGLANVRTVVDLGAGSGRDLAIVKKIHPLATTIAIEAGHHYAEALAGKADEVHIANIEREPLPFVAESVDLVIANQVMEHTKEVFWIFHEVTRCLRIGGHFLMGVPNVASLHNRLLLMVGRHPTQHTLCSAHVRPFSKADTIKFVDACFPGGYELADFRGAQFYPFPPRLARLLARTFPQSAFSIFFLFRKRVPYTASFATYPAMAHLETNFWAGDVHTQHQYW